MKILVFINHYFGLSNGFVGGSTRVDDASRRSQRQAHLDKCILSLKSLGDQVDIRICGVNGCALVPLDHTFDFIKDRPTHLVYESLELMTKVIDQYDYFVNIEDDILLSKEAFNNILRFDKCRSINEILLPNRLEMDQTGHSFCIDLYCIPGWTSEFLTYENRDLRVAKNPHSGLLVMSQQKLRYAIDNIDTSFRGIVLCKEMDSAFAHFHSPFKLFRSFSDPDWHVVHHLDRFKGSPNIIDKAHPHSPYGFKGEWERPLKALLPDFVYRRLKYRKILPRR